MTLYRYVALAPDGAQRMGAFDLADEAAVIARIRREGLLPVSVTPADTARTSRFMTALNMPAVSSGPGLRRGEVVEMMRELSLMLGAGQDLDRSLRYVAESASRPAARVLLGRLRDRVRDGRSLADAMTETGRGFSRLQIGLVRAGEASGTLPAVLADLAAFLEREARQSASLRTAMIYPGVLMVASIGAIVMLLTEILPQFTPLFAENGAVLPLPTRIVIAAGDWVGRYGLLAVLAAIMLGVAARAALRVQSVRLWADGFRLRLPIVGGVSREAMAARLCRTLGTLLCSGVALIPALGIARDVLGNAAGVAALDAAALQARQGGGLARPLASAGLFPKRMTDLLALGEETAQLGPLALRAAEIHEERVRVLLQRLTALLVPGITIVMGALVAGIVSALLLAMIGLNDLAQ